MDSDEAHMPNPSVSCTNTSSANDSESTRVKDTDNSTDLGMGPPISARTDVVLSGVKYIELGGVRYPIFTQLLSGPCPLLAIMNALVLQGRLHIELPPEQDMIENETLLIHLLTFTTNLSKSSNDQNDEYKLLLNESVEIASTLSKGLNLNVYFSGVSKFEYTKEIGLLDILDLRLYHGWIIDPNETELYEQCGKCSYNELMMKMCGWDGKGTESQEYRNYVLATNFLNEYPTQLSKYGLELLKDSIPENIISLFFRNDHFSTIIRRGQKLYSLVTDYGYQNDRNIVWETVTLKGAGTFYNSRFETVYQSGIDQGSISSSTETNNTTPTVTESQNAHSATRQQKNQNDIDCYIL
ncbi:hypothetical protein RF11_10304 [Thelohanellus kitauei]|uniref:Ubiquitin carboxyl-terminal hydrolase n=1 Tax=Thelohanellus kitauei TaxID=669202 RepID=A0A0C2MN39_THEKT|nr:hypothetical protein RF11_10304 [Thelohanellus kitauei]